MSDCNDDVSYRGNAPKSLNVKHSLVIVGANKNPQQLLSLWPEIAVDGLWSKPTKTALQAFLKSKVMQDCTRGGGGGGEGREGDVWIGRGGVGAGRGKGKKKGERGERFVVACTTRKPRSVEEGCLATWMKEKKAMRGETKMMRSRKRVGRESRRRRWKGRDEKSGEVGVGVVHVSQVGTMVNFNVDGRFHQRSSQVSRQMQSHSLSDQHIQALQIFLAQEGWYRPALHNLTNAHQERNSHVNVLTAPMKPCSEPCYTSRFPTSQMALCLS
eukprot:765509-Hanusia_phi.AAC.1